MKLLSVVESCLMPKLLLWSWSRLFKCVAMHLYTQLYTEWTVLFVLVSSLNLAVWHQLCVLCQVFMTCSVTKATPIHFINRKCDIKFNKSHRSMSYHWSLVSSGFTCTHTHTRAHTHTHAHTLQTKTISRNQVLAGLCPVHMVLKLF